MEKITYKATIRFPNSVNHGFIQILRDGLVVIAIFTHDIVIGNINDGYLHILYSKNGIEPQKKFDIYLKNDIEEGTTYFFTSKDSYDSSLTFDCIEEDEENINFLEKHFNIKFKE